MSDTGSLTETYAAALQHDLVELPSDATTVGVVRRPTRWFGAAVDENYPALGPPDSLLAEFDRRHEDLKMRGLCDEGAHNAAWEEIDFESRYCEYLDRFDDARGALDALDERRRSGEDIALVCYENAERKRCHRTIILDRLRERCDLDSSDAGSSR